MPAVGTMKDRVSTPAPNRARTDASDAASLDGIVEIRPGQNFGGPAPDVGDFGDAALVRRLKRNDGRAYEEVMRELGPRLMATASRMMGNDDDAREALQDAFLSAFRNIQNFDEQSKFSTWLHRIVINACLMKLRTRRRKPSMSIEDVGGRNDDGEPTALPIANWRERAPDDHDEEARTRLRTEIQELPDDYRTVIMLRDIEELDTEETATVLGISSSAVKTRLHRARLALRDRLDTYMRSDSGDHLRDGEGD
jgi:RNA polymerase sigma-70 factor, ECF subfamily